MVIALLVSTRGIFSSGELNGPIPGRTIMLGVQRPTRGEQVVLPLSTPHLSMN